jgi:hypothetical protein
LKIAVKSMKCRKILAILFILLSVSSVAHCHVLFELPQAVGQLFGRMMYSFAEMFSDNHEEPEKKPAKRKFKDLVYENDAVAE